MYFRHGKICYDFELPILLRRWNVAGQRKVVWHNMREEPVLYINGKPYVVREANKPFANLEYTGRSLKLA